MPISYSRVIEYLDAIDAKAHRKATNAPHGRFWRPGPNGLPLTRDQFVNGILPGVTCNGAAIPLVDQINPAQSSFFVALIVKNPDGGFCAKGQMPKAQGAVT